MRTLFGAISLAFLALLYSRTALGHQLAASVSFAHHSIVFTDQAAGGHLTLSYRPSGRFCCSVTVVTNTGADGAHIAARLARAASEDNPFATFAGGAKFDGEGIELYGRKNGGRFILAGTEAGLGIPEPPEFLSGNHWRDADLVELFWRNPHEAYDEIAVVGTNGTVDIIDGTAESYSLAGAKHRFFGSGGIFSTVLVVGYRDDIPSNAGIIRLGHGVQQETAKIPFRNNTFPNWVKWEREEAKGSIVLDERSAVIAHKESLGIELEDIAYYQSVRSHGGAGEGGVYRKFLGLVPGHTYRFMANVNTWEMDDATQEWSYSIHVSPGFPDGREFTPAHFSGEEPLPDGSLGLEAGRLVSFGPDYTTGGKWMEVSTDYRGLPGQTIGEITLPGDATELVVWIRHTGTDTSGVGLDWVRLEDLDED